MNTQDAVCRLLAQATGQPVDAQSRIVHDLGLDSLQMISFLLELEAELHIAIPFESLELTEIETVGAFVQWLDRHGS